MKINEVEKLLNIPKATIRFYEKEGLLTPQRYENTYREYSDTDIETLKKIVVLRKIGLSVYDIKQVQNGKLLLQDVLSKNLTNLYTQMEEVKGAIKVCDLMQKKDENFASLNEDYYWNIIHDEEANGHSFIDIAKDYVLFEKDVLDKVTGGGNKKFITIVGRLILWMTVFGLVALRKGGTFFDGVNSRLILLLIVSLAFVPAFILRNKITAKDTYLKWLKRAPLILLIVLLAIIMIMKIYWLSLG